MICEACNKQVRDGAKFCGQCGAKTQLAPPLSTSGASEQKYELRTLSVNATGPDSDGDLSVEIKVAITNRSGADWDQVNTRTQLISASGFIEETSDSHDLVVEDGETEEFEVNFYGVKARPFLANPELTKTIINVVACSASSKKLGEVSLPETSFDVVKVEPTDISDTVKLLSAGVWRTDPDDDKDVRVEARWLVQNLTDTHLPEVRFTAEVVGKSGAEIGDAGGYEELRPGVSAVINGSTYSKEKKLKGALVQMVARVMSPTAGGRSEHMGIVLIPSSDTRDDADNSGDSNRWEEDTSEGSAPYKEATKRTFYANMKWFDVAEQPPSEKELPEAFAKARALWQQDKEGNLDEILVLLSEYVGAFFIPGNISGWEELFNDPSGDGMPEIDATEIKVVGIDFSSSPIPKCKAEATFIVDVTASFGSTDLEEWQENNGTFTDAISFYWNIPRTESTEDLDFTYGDNQGVECNALDEEPIAQNSTSPNPEYSKDGIEGENKVLVEWSIKRAVVNVDDVEDEDTKNALIEVIKLCKEMHYDEALAMLPKMTFEFDSDNMDSSADDYLAEGVDSFVLDPNNKSHSIRVGLDGNKLILSIAVVFEMSLVSGVTAEVLDEWLSDNGGWAAATVAGQWQYSEDDGGSFASVKSNMHAESNTQQVSCRYCVDFGKYIFASEEERDAFIKDPQFLFDFQPENVDDKKGMVRIFGSTVDISPIYKDNAPKFIITHLEKNEDNELGVIVSVEVEMAFEIRVGIEEFSEWIDSSDSTWRYSGRIECVGEDGMEDSDREEYEFNW